MKILIISLIISITGVQTFGQEIPSCTTERQMAANMNQNIGFVSDSVSKSEPGKRSHEDVCFEIGLATVDLKFLLTEMPVFSPIKNALVTAMVGPMNFLTAFCLVPDPRTPITRLKENSLTLLTLLKAYLSSI